MRKRHLLSTVTIACTVLGIACATDDGTEVHLQPGTGTSGGGRTLAPPTRGVFGDDALEINLCS